MDYKDVQSTYNYWIYGEFFKFLALYVFSISAGLFVLYNLPNKKVAALVIVIGIILMGLPFSFYQKFLPICQDLIKGHPMESVGTFSNKSTNITYRGSTGIEFDIDENIYKIVGDQRKNGFDKANDGDYVRIWYGDNTKKVFLIKVLRKSQWVDTK